MYKYAGFGLIVLIVVLMMPAGIDDQPTNIPMYGTTHVEQYDSHGNQIFSQTVHNLITNNGENFLIQQVFRETTNGQTDDDFQIGSICITDSTTDFSESQAASGTDGDFDNEETLTGNNCIEDDNASNNNGALTIGPLTFSAGTHLGAGETIQGIGICQGNNGADNNAYADCATGGNVLFATIDTSDVTVNGGETAEYSYTFDISGSP